MRLEGQTSHGQGQAKWFYTTTLKRFAARVIPV
jgi:hypothetical protein